MWIPAVVENWEADTKPGSLFCSLGVVLEEISGGFQRMPFLEVLTMRINV